MTKLVVWNIRDFGINKVNNPENRKAPGCGGLKFPQACAVRLSLIDLALFASAPDIVVVIEVTSGDNRVSDLASQTGGMQASIFLLNYLRSHPVYGPGDWRLVPPLRVGIGGKTETVAVLYRGSLGPGAGQRFFTGPNRWSGAYDGWSVEPSDGNGNAYPTPAPGSPNLNINSMLVPPATAPRAIPAGAQHNAGVAEDRVAARTRFREDQNGAPAGYLDFSALREPCMVTFSETDNAGTVHRNLTLFAVHSPVKPPNGSPKVYVSALTSMFDVVGPQIPTETRVICGDFNINLLTSQGGDAGFYQPLINNNYALLLAPPAAPPQQQDLDAFRGYFATHIKPSPGMEPTKESLFLWSDPPKLSNYPSYGNIGSELIDNFFSIDNILVKPFQPAPYNYRTTVMNLVTGTPMAAVAPPPNGAPPGSVPMADRMGLAPWPPAPAAAPWTGLGAANHLVSWAHYGKIYNTSDHFAVYSEI